MTKEELIDLFIKLALIEGVSHKEKNVADFIFSYLKDLNYEPVIDNSAEAAQSNTGNIICEVNGGGEILLSSHMDTARSTAGLVVQNDDDKLTSDGSTVLGVDNRIGNTILLAIAKQAAENNAITKGFTLAYTTCEETTLSGSKNIELNGSTNRAFVFDSYLRPGNFIRSSLGAASFEIEIIGKASHAGISPEQGVNAISIASEAIGKLKTGHIKNSTTLNFGKIYGGSAVNVVPERVVVEGEIRSSSAKRVEEELVKVESVFNQTASSHNGTINFKYSWDFMPYFIDENEVVYKEIHSAISKAGLTPTASESNGGSDANSFNARGIKAVNIGIGAQNPHSNDEFIYHEDLENSYKIALQLVTLDD